MIFCAFRLPGCKQRRGAPEIELLRKNRAMPGDDGNPEAPGALLHQVIADQGRRRRQQASRRGIGRVLQPFVGAVHADQPLDFVVVGRHILVGNRPVEPQAVAGVRLEIVRPIAQRDAAPVIGAAAQHARAPPGESSMRIARGLHIGFPGNRPAAVDRGVVESEGLFRRRGAAQGRLIRRLKHRRFLFRYVFAPRFQHEHLHAFHAQGIGSLPARGAGADDDDVVVLSLGRGGWDTHIGMLSNFRDGRELLMGPARGDS